MKVDKQSVVALLGGNGTGKSTILKAASGLIRSWKGTIEFNNEQIREIQDIYRIIYQSGKNISQAVESVKVEFHSSQLASEIIDFIQSSERGLIRK